MTQGAVGGLAGQAGAGAVAVPGANQVGAPTVPETISGPAGTTGTTQSNPNSVNTTGAVTSGFGNGFAGGVLATPTADFAAPQPTAGISLANRAGISSNTPVETGVQNTLPPSTLVYTNVEPVNPGAVNTNPSTAGGPVYDFGPSYYAGAASVSAVPATTAAVSLGEVAARLKGEKTTQNVRTYTNADVQQINENMKLQGVNVNARLQQSPQPATPGVVVANGQPASTNTQVAIAPAASAQNQPQLSASARPSPAIREEQAQSAPAAPAPAATQSAQESSATTPQVNQPKPGSQSEQESSRQLPATATWLPLLGIIGLASGGIGLVFRKYRK
jgi:LPXTG-motif cell wall-anchored protein